MGKILQGTLQPNRLIFNGLFTFKDEDALATVRKERLARIREGYLILILKRLSMTKMSGGGERICEN